jgi:hypothetical protein
MNRLYFVIIISLVVSCNYQKSESQKLSDFEKSFKEQKGEGFVEHLDSTANIYSNFRYHVAFDAPDNWETDLGVSEHTIFRTFQTDSSLTFSINVIEQKLSEKEKKIDIWELYEQYKEQFDYQIRTTLEKQLNTKLENLVSQKSYLRNNVSLKQKYNYKFRNLEYEYDVTNISYQTLIGDFTYTFTLSIPTILYEENTEFYDNLFRNIYFLKDGELVEDVIKKSMKN